MPIYEYECRKCKAHVEILQKVTDKPLTKCRKCGGRMEKQWSSAGFQFKGSGWYVTDYASKKSESSSEEKKSASTEASDTNTATAKSDKKSAKEESAPPKKSGGTKASASSSDTASSK